MSNKTKIPKCPKGWRRIRPGSRERLLDRYRYIDDGWHESLAMWSEISHDLMCSSKSAAHWIVIRRLAPRKGRGK